MELIVVHDGEYTNVGDLLAGSFGGDDGRVMSITADGEIQALWGYGDWPEMTQWEDEEGEPVPKHPLAPNAYVWLVGTDALFDQYPFEMTRRFSKKILPALLEVYGSVGNFVMAANEVHLNWLKSCGFKCYAYEEINGEEFHLMVKTNV